MNRTVAAVYIKVKSIGPPGFLATSSAQFSTMITYGIMLSSYVADTTIMASMNIPRAHFSALCLIYGFGIGTI